jgi:hypothetical protein
MLGPRAAVRAPSQPSRYIGDMRWLALALLLGAATRPAFSAARPPRLKITGKVTLEEKRLPPGRKVRAQLSRDFPAVPGAVDFTVKVDGSGHFTFDRVPEGNWWLLAWIDDDGDGKLTPGKEIMGYSTINPVPIGEGRTSFAAKLDLDPIQVTLVTRFEPARGPAPARRVLESLRVVPLDPKTGKFLDDAEVIVSQKKIQLAPDGGSFLFAPDPPEEVAGRYTLEVTHPVFGRAAKKRLIAPRAFGAVPDAKLEGRRVSWTQPPWANMAQVRATAPGGNLLYDRAARSPLDLTDLVPNATVRVRVGRVDIQHAGAVTLQVGEAVLKAGAALPPNGTPASAPTASAPGAAAAPPAGKTTPAPAPASKPSSAAPPAPSPANKAPPATSPAPSPAPAIKAPAPAPPPATTKP